jgi:uncharacterized protein
MNIVLDTNALVSGLLTPFSPSGEIIRMITGGELVLLFDARILLEYEEVLNRPKFKFKKEHISTLLDFIQQNGKLVSSLPLKKSLPDPDDEPFLEVSIAGKAKCLVTGNIAHYPAVSRQGTIIFSPSEFLEYYRKQNVDAEPAS